MTDASNSTTPDQTSYAQEIERRVDDLIRWSVDNAPADFEKLSVDDFAEVRKKFCFIAQGGGNPLEQEPEPEEGGAQYVSMNPAPWP